MPVKASKAATVDKPSYSLDSPYSKITWPTTSCQNQTVILDQLCSLLNPVGDHRLRYITPSKGKRGRKRKHGDVGEREDIIEDFGNTSPGKQDPKPPIPAVPEVHFSLTLGFNSTQRYLESAAQRSVPPNIATRFIVETDLPLLKPLAAVFVDRSDQPSILYAHLPLLVATASLSASSEPAIRLVTLPRGSSARLSAALHVPRVGIIGLKADSSNARPLISFIREHVDPIEVSWLNDVREGNYLPASMNITNKIAPPVHNQTSRPAKQLRTKNQKAVVQLA